MKRVKTIIIRKLRFEDAKQKFLTELEQAFFKSHSQIEVLHGIGNYTLRDMVWNEIHKIDYADVRKHFFNPGISIIELHLPDEEILRKYI